MTAFVAQVDMAIVRVGMAIVRVDMAIVRTTTATGLLLELSECTGLKGVQTS